MKYEHDKSMCGNGKNCKSGKWTLFNVFYDGSVSKNQEDKYKLRCYLPGLKDNLGHFKTEREAIDKAEIVLKYWIKYLDKKLFGGEQ